MGPHSHRTCPRCDSPLTGAEAACPKCRLALAGDRLAPGPGDQAVCPICKIPVYDAVMADLPVMHCAECKGMGLKREIMMKMQPCGAKEIVIGKEERGYKRAPFFEPRQKPPFLICPSCKKRMKETTLSKMTADLCETCGTLWIDEARSEHLNDMLAPYKWKMSKEKR